MSDAFDALPGSDDAPAVEPAELLVKEPLVSETHPELFHYTTLIGLRGILESNQLWATSAFHLNDRTEMQLFWGHLEVPLRDALESATGERIKAQPEWGPRVAARGGPALLAADEAGNWLGAARKSLFGDRGQGGVAHPYVVSFTTHSGDGEIDVDRREHGMLSQWRGYAAGDGVAIVFDPRALEHLLVMEASHFQYWPILLTEAVYKGIAGRFEPLVAEMITIAPLLVNLRHEEAHELLHRLSGDLATAVTRVKHWGFLEEFECRIVAGATPAGLQRDLVEAGDPGHKAFKLAHMRRGRNGSVPYIKLFEDLGERMPITRIIVGPSRDQRAVLNEARALMLKHGYDPGDVQLSEIPYVGSA